MTNSKTKIGARCVISYLRVSTGKQTEENFARAHSRALLGKSSEVSDVVQAVKYLVEAPAVTGVTITVDGGQHMYPTKRDVQFEN